MLATGPNTRGDISFALRRLPLHRQDRRCYLVLDSISSSGFTRVVDNRIRKETLGNRERKLLEPYLNPTADSRVPTTERYHGLNEYVPGVSELIGIRTFSKTTMV